MHRLSGPTVFALLILPQCAPAPGPVARTAMLTDIHGRECDVLEPEGAAATLIVFAGVECPIARAYSPEIAALASDYAERIAVRVVLVDVDLDAETARRHAVEFHLPHAVFLDPTHRLVHMLGATITPECFLIDRAGTPIYSGRIDDRYADLGRPRQAPRSRDLRDAITALLDDRPVPHPRTKAVGCLIE